MSLLKLQGNATGTGTFIIAAPNTNSTRTLTLPDVTGTLLTNSGTEAGSFSTLSANGDNISAVNSLGFRNRIINGDMRVNQRNTSLTNTGYSVDRWSYDATQASKATVAQSAVAPTGFSNSLGVTSSSAYSLAAGDYFTLSQPIEGLNVSDLAWGTSSAVSVTLSFQVYSSLTGTFGGAIYAGTGSLTYPFTYSVSAANTWTSVSLTIPGPTTGTWSTDNTRSIVVCFGLGVGTTYSGTAGSWQASVLRSVTGATSVVGTNGATFYITRVQLEAGTVASPFERRPYGEMLTLCQRYFEAVTFSGIYVADLFPGSSGQARGVIVPFTVQKRATPTISYSSASYTSTYSPSSGQIVVWSIGAASIYTGNSGGTSVLTTYGNISINNVNTGINNVNIGAADNGLIGIGGSTVFASSEI